MMLEAMLLVLGVYFMVLAVMVAAYESGVAQRLLGRAEDWLNWVEYVAFET